MKLDRSDFPYAPRIGDCVQLRRPIKSFLKRAESSVTVMVTSLAPLAGDPVELTRTWWYRDKFCIHRRRLKR